MSLLKRVFITFAVLVMAVSMSTGAQADQIIAVERTDEVTAQVRTAWVNNSTGRCMAVKAADNRNGAPAFQYDCLSYADQFWNVEPAGGGKVRIKNAYTGRCLAVKAADNRNGAPVFQYDCLDYADQYWYITRYVNERGEYLFSTLTNSYTGRCAIVKASDNYNGAAVFQYDCIWHYKDQQWKIYNV